MLGRGGPGHGGFMGTSGFEFIICYYVWSNFSAQAGWDG